MRNFLKRWYSRIFLNVRHKYRLVIMDESFEEKLSFRLSRMNVFVVTGMTCIVLVLGTTFLIAFTPLREFIPGYTKYAVEQMAYQSQLKIDSLEIRVQQSDALLYAMNQAISGKASIEEVPQILDSSRNYENLPYERSKEDEQLRKEMESGGKYNLAQMEETPSLATEAAVTSSAPGTVMTFARPNAKQMLYYVPLQGTVLADFDLHAKHLGMDLIGKKDDAIKCIGAGTVIMAEWTVDAAYVITIQHDDNFLSIYKHNSALLKGVGDYVRAGEPIAFIGNSGEGYKGPILHFELWYNGSPVNPRNYIPF